MYLRSLATAVPPRAYSPAECWAIIEQSPMRARLKDRSLSILRKVLLGDSGVGKRHFALDDVERIFDLAPDELNAAFQFHAPRLAATALQEALARAEILPSELDALLICTCTGYLCPGVSSYVAEILDLRREAYLQDLVGLGCGAAIPTLRSASHFLAAHPDATVACIAVEICSAAFYLDDDPGVLISACIFADGAAASIWGGRREGARLRCGGFQTVHVPEDRQYLRFETRQGKLRNRLHKSVPDRAAAAVSGLFHARPKGETPHILIHPGGRDVLIALASALPGHPLAESAAVLQNFGNMSSPSILFALDHHLRERGPTERPLWLSSFGAGFSAHACTLSDGHRD